MSQPKRPPEEPRSNPFDNPRFLPVLLLGLGIWFAYDGWLNPRIQAVWFNRIGALLLLAAALVTGVRTRRARSGVRGRSAPPDAVD